MEARQLHVEPARLAACAQFLVEAGRGLLIQCAIEQGWAEPWFKNPIKPDWLVCRLTGKGRQVAEAATPDPQADDVAEDGADTQQAKVRNLVDDLFA